MAKKQNTKNKKTNKKQTPAVEEQKKDTKEFAHLIKIILIVTAIFVVFYGITLIVTKTADSQIRKEKKENATVEKAEIQYEDIIIGTMLNHGGTYYVLIEQKDDNRVDEYKATIESIKSNEDAPIIYMANLTDSFNKKYLAKEPNYYVDDMSEFKVKGTTLVKITDNKVDSVYDNHDAIKNKLSELS